MKNSIFSIFLLIPFFAFAQGFTIIGTADNGKTDTVSFGYKTNATLGIDPALGEVNLFGQPAKEVDMRVVQRDSLNFSCTYTFSPVFRDDTFKHFFPIKFDSKTNFRNRTDTSFINRIFEVKFFTKNIKKISISSWREPNLPNVAIWDSLDFFIDTCLSKPNQNFASYSWGPTSSDPVRLLATNYFANFLIVFKKGTLTSYKDSKAAVNIRIFPNPVSDRLTVDNIGDAKIQEIKLFDILGRQVLSQKTNFSERIDIDVSQLPQGTYCVSLFDKENRLFSSKMVVKTDKK